MTTLDQAVSDLRTLRKTTGYKIQYCAQQIAQRTGWDYGRLLSVYNKKAVRKRKPSRQEFQAGWWNN